MKNVILRGYSKSLKIPYNDYELSQDASRLQSRIRYTTKNSSRSTPTSPSRTREPQCTCMTPEQFSNLRAQRNHRIRGSYIGDKKCHFLVTKSFFISCNIIVRYHIQLFNAIFCVGLQKLLLITKLIEKESTFMIFVVFLLRCLI